MKFGLHWKKNQEIKQRAAKKTTNLAMNLRNEFVKHTFL